MLARPAILAIIVVLATLAVVVIPVEAEKIELTLRDSGYDLAAGYRYTIGMVSRCVWTGACARAEVHAGPIKAELRGSHLKVWINDNIVFDQDVAEEVTLVIVVECDGSGRVEVVGHGVVGGFSIDHSYRIMVYTESVSAPITGSVTSSVTISRQAMNCQVTNPSLTPVQENPANQANYNPLLASIANAMSMGAMIAVVLVLLGLGIVCILIFVKQAKRRRWI